MGIHMDAMQSCMSTCDSIKRRISQKKREIACESEANMLKCNFSHFTKDKIDIIRRSKKGPSFPQITLQDLGPLNIT